MALFVDEQQKHDGTIIRRMMMSNLSIAELNAEAEKLKIPVVETFRIDRLPHYMLTEAQRLEAVADGAQEVAYNSPEWRDVHRYAVKLPR